MDAQRNILIIAFVFVTFLLYQQWNMDLANPPGQKTSSSSDSSFLNNRTQVSASLDLIKVKTDVLDVVINLRGGDLVHADLLKYDAEKNSNEAFTLLKQTPNHSFTLQSGLIGPQGSDKNNQRPLYKADATTFEMSNGSEFLDVTLSYLSDDNIIYSKTFRFKRGRYDVELIHSVNNQSDHTATFAQYTHLHQTAIFDSGSMFMPTYLGAAYATEDERYQKYSFSDMEKKNLSLNLSQGNGWVAMIQHYFTAAIVPTQIVDTKIYSRYQGGTADMGVLTPQYTLQPQESRDIKMTLWIGPKLPKPLEAIHESLDLVADYGWLWFISKPLNSFLTFIYSFVGNWGLAIITLTFIIRGLMYPLTKVQYTSMAKMRMLQPQITEMKERFGDDRQRMSKEMMDLYKREKVNPLGGCLPLLLQMPVFIALYWALIESVDLRHSPFFAWVTDLSAQDPYYVLPLLMGVSMFIIQKMSPMAITDPIQRKVMTFMPVVFTVFFLWFPAGLVLYWLTSNIVTIVQQLMIFRALEKKGLYSR